MTDRHRARKGEAAAGSIVRFASISIPVRLHQDRDVVETITVPADGAVAAFAALVDAVDTRDYRAATAIRRRLYRLGWSIIPPRTPSWPGRRP
jgi:hypothetical protein